MTFGKQLLKNIKRIRNILSNKAIKTDSLQIRDYSHCSVLKKWSLCLHTACKFRTLEPFQTRVLHMRCHLSFSATTNSTTVKRIFHSHSVYMLRHICSHGSLEDFKRSKLKTVLHFFLDRINWHNVESCTTTERKDHSWRVFRPAVVVTRSVTSGSRYHSKFETNTRLTTKSAKWNTICKNVQYRQVASIYNASIEFLSLPVERRQ